MLRQVGMSAVLILVAAGVVALASAQETLPSRAENSTGLANRMKQVRSAVTKEYAAPQELGAISSRLRPLKSPTGLKRLSRPSSRPSTGASISESLILAKQPSSVWAKNQGSKSQGVRPVSGEQAYSSALKRRSRVTVASSPIKRKPIPTPGAAAAVSRTKTPPQTNPASRTQTTTQTEPPRRRKASSSSSRRLAQLEKSPSALPKVAAGRVAANSRVGSRDLIMSSVSPSIRVDTFGPRAITKGKEAVYTIALTNVSDVTARNIQVVLDVPAWVDLLGGASNDGQSRNVQDATGHTRLAWQLAELPGQSKSQLKMSVIPRENKPFDIQVTWATAESTLGSEIEVQEPQLAVNIAGPNDIMYGDSKVYTITLSNPGTGDAENVVLRLAALTSEDAPPQAKNIGVIGAGQRRDIKVELTAQEAGNLAIHVQAIADGGLEAEAQEEVLVRRGKLAVKAEGPQLKYAGGQATYKIQLTNTGNAAVDKVAAMIQLPPGAEIVSKTDADNNGKGRLDWRLGSLAPGDARELEVRCILNQAGEFPLSVQVESGEGLTAKGEVVTRVEALADLKLVVNDPKGPISVGKNVEYEIRILNRGTKAATQINLTAFFSAGVEPTAVSGGQARISDGQVEFSPFAQLGAGQEMVLKIVVRATAPGNHAFRAVVTCTDPDTRLAAEETTRFFGDAVPSVSAKPTPANGFRKRF